MPKLLRKKETRLRSRDSVGTGGFTLIELLVVIAIISLLASVILSSLSEARSKANDARRKSDLNQITKALLLYYDKYGNYMESGSGCGYNNDGNGWFSHQGGVYYVAMSQCLVNQQLTGTQIIDPTGGTTSSSASGYSYMKYNCTQNGARVSYVYAKLESIPQSSTATDGTCCTTCDSSYGMNYYRLIP